MNALKMLARLLNESRVLIFRFLISSNLNHCPITWIFCGLQNVTKLEELQERILRVVFMDNISSYMDLLKRGNFLEP